MSSVIDKYNSKLISLEGMSVLKEIATSLKDISTCLKEGIKIDGSLDFIPRLKQGDLPKGILQSLIATELVNIFNQPGIDPEIFEKLQKAIKDKGI